MNETTIRVGVVGAGRNTREKHIPSLQAIEGVVVVSVCNRSRESSERVAKQFGIAKVYEQWWELVEAADTEAIVIGTWPYMHHPITLAALATGKHVMCEARMAMNLEEAREMLRASQERPHLVAQIVPSPFTLRIDRTVQRLIGEGYLGDVLAIEVQEQGSFLDREAPLHWRQDAAVSGLNVMGLGIWYEAVMRWVGQATRLMAMGRTFVKMRREPQSGRMRTVTIPEHLDVVAEMACGAQAHFSLSQVSGMETGVSMRLSGSEGVLCYADGRLKGKRRGEATFTEIAIRPEEVGGWRVEEEFVNAIRGREPITLTTFTDGVKYMAFTEAVARSIAAGRIVELT